jgi:radical SAM protein with 4Fe4S-binding SPASM domain
MPHGDRLRLQRPWHVFLAHRLAGGRVGKRGVSPCCSPASALHALIRRTRTCEYSHGLMDSWTRGLMASWAHGRAPCPHQHPQEPRQRPRTEGSGLRCAPFSHPARCTGGAVVAVDRAPQLSPCDAFVKIAIEAVDAGGAAAKGFRTCARRLPCCQPSRTVRGCSACQERAFCSAPCHRSAIYATRVAPSATRGIQRRAERSSNQAQARLAQAGGTAAGRLYPRTRFGTKRSAAGQ